MFDPWSFFIVHGYGCDLNTPLKPYLDFVSHRIAQELPAVVFLTGGETQKEQFPGLTEAGVMFEYLSQRARVTKNVLPAMILETNSFTTQDNVRNACARIRRTQDIQANWHRVRVRAFCELQRGLKSSIYYWDSLPELRPHGQRVWIESQSWELQDPRVELARTNAAGLMPNLPFVGSMMSAARRIKSHFQ